MQRTNSIDSEEKKYGNIKQKEGRCIWKEKNQKKRAKTEKKALSSQVSNYKDTVNVERENQFLKKIIVMRHEPAFSPLSAFSWHAEGVWTPQ